MAGQAQESVRVTGTIDGSLYLLLHCRSSPQGRQACGEGSPHEHLLSTLDAIERVLGRRLHFDLHLHCHIHPLLFLSTPYSRGPNPQLSGLRLANSGSTEHLQCQQVALISLLAVPGRNDNYDGFLRMDWMYPHHRCSSAQRQD